jgi:hypothetical protein
MQINKLVLDNFRCFEQMELDLHPKIKKKTRYGLAYEPYCMAAVHYLESKKKN